MVSKLASIRKKKKIGVSLAYLVEYGQWKRKTANVNDTEESMPCIIGKVSLGTQCNLPVVTEDTQAEMNRRKCRNSDCKMCHLFLLTSFSQKLRVVKCLYMVHDY